MLLNIRNKLIVAALIATFIAVAAHVKFDNYHLTINDGLPSNTIYDI